MSEHYRRLAQECLEMAPTIEDEDSRAIKKELCAIKKVETRGHNLGRMFITSTVVPRERDPLRSAKQACKTSTRSRGFLLRARRERLCDGP